MILCIIASSFSQTHSSILHVPLSGTADGTASGPDWNPVLQNVEAPHPGVGAPGNEFAEAKEKADVMAKAGDFKIGKLISIQEGGGFPPPIPLRAKALSLEAGFGGEAAPAIEPGSQEVVVNVTLQYEIK